MVHVSRKTVKSRGKYFILRGGFLPGELSQSAWYIELLECIFYTPVSIFYTPIGIFYTPVSIFTLQ